VTLNAAAPAGGQVVGLSSSSTAVTVPTSVTVAAGATSASFQAAISSVSSAQTATLAATVAGTAKSFSLSLGSGIAKLTLSSTSLNFGSINVASTASQSVTLTSSGTASLTISAATISGTGFTLSGASFPLTLTAGQTAVLTVGFDPTVAGATSGSVILTSNSSTGTSSTVALSGTGQAVPFEVSLNWEAPESTSVTVVGYNVYRAISGTSSYSIVNPSLDASTNYTDTTVVNGSSYMYYVVSVDSIGNQSAPSGTFNAIIP
jgi:hypothetical protein